MRIQFSPSTLNKIKTPEKSRVWYRDTKVVGLALMATSGGGRVFYVDVWRNGKRRQVKLGAYPAELSVDQARQLARDEINRAEQGREPGAKGFTFGELFLKWHATVAVPTKRTAAEDMRRFRRDLVPLHNIPAQTLTADHIDSVLRTLMADAERRGTKTGGRTNCNRLLALIRVVLNWSIRREYIARNPANQISKFKERSRSRKLGPAELSRFMAAVEAEEDPWRDFYKLVLFTGARRGNVAAMRWEAIDFEQRTWTIPASEAKGDEAVEIPLLPDAWEILERRKLEQETPWPFVFPSGNSRTGHIVDPRKSWSRIQKAAGIEDVTIHDLRRTLGSLLANAGTDIAIVARLMGHADSRITEQVYARYDLAPKRAALEAIADQLAGRKGGEA